MKIKVKRTMRLENEIKQAYEHFCKVNKTQYWSDLSVGIEEALEWVLYEDVGDLYTVPEDEDISEYARCLEKEMENAGSKL